MKAKSEPDSSRAESSPSTLWSVRSSEDLPKCLILSPSSWGQSRSTCMTVSCCCCCYCYVPPATGSPSRGLTALKSPGRGPQGRDVIRAPSLGHGRVDVAGNSMSGGHQRRTPQQHVMWRVCLFSACRTEGRPARQGGAARALRRWCPADPVEVLGRPCPVACPQLVYVDS